MDASEIYSKKTQCERGDISQKCEIRSRWTKNCWTRPGTENIHLDTGPPIRGEGQRDFPRESEGSPPPPPQDSLRDAGEAMK